MRLSAVGVKITVFWDMTPCTLLKSCRRSEAPAAPYYHSLYVKAHGATFLNALIVNISNPQFFLAYGPDCLPVCYPRVSRLYTAHRTVILLVVLYGCETWSGVVREQNAEDDTSV